VLVVAAQAVEAQLVQQELQTQVVVVAVLEVITLVGLLVVRALSFFATPAQFNISLVAQ
jgi:F0F1-type ATP synthase membrane subunit c/vacuolar-type H+-ATPase subunit K